MFSFGGVQLGGNFRAATRPSGADPVLQPPHRPQRRSRIVPLDVGGRLTGRAGRYSVGVVNIQTGDEDDALASPARPPTSRWCASSATSCAAAASGVIATGRSVGAERHRARNLAYGVDGTFAFFDNLTINTYWARTETDRHRAATTRATARSSTTTATATACSSSGWRSATTSTPRSASCAATTCARNFGQVRFSPRPRSRCRRSAASAIRRPSTTSRTAPGVLESREQEGEFAIEFQNGDQFTRRLQRPVRVPAACRSRIAPAIAIPVGGYDFDERAGRLQPGPPAARCRRRRLGRVRHLLQRPRTTLSACRRAASASTQRALGRADLLAEQGEPGRGPIHDTPRWGRASPTR